MKNSHSRAVGVVMAISISALIISGCSKSKSTNPPPPPIHSAHFHSVGIADFAFSPSTLTIPAGDTVNWTNNGPSPHTVTSLSGSELNSGNLSSGSGYLHVFGVANTFPYHCTIHTSMTGSVTVQ